MLFILYRETLPFAESIPSLRLETDSVMNVVVVSVESLTSLIVQPYGNELEDFSTTLRYNPKNTYGFLLYYIQ